MKINIRKLDLNSSGFEQRLEIFTSIIGNFKVGKTVDLGCGHCKFGLIAKELGWDVTFVDARKERIPANISFVQENILNYHIPNVNVILLLGVLYHLTLEEQLKLLERCKDRTTIIDTHFTSKPTHTFGDYQGRFYNEAKDFQTLMKNAKASITTLRSFWHTKESLLKMFENIGYKTVDIIEPYHHPERTFFICKPY